MTILLDRLLQHPEYAVSTKAMMDGAVPLRVHSDVITLAEELTARDSGKLKASAGQLFMPANTAWFEWPMGPEGDMALMFQGLGGVQQGKAIFLAWKHGQATPTFTALDVDLTGYGFRLSSDAQASFADPIRAAASVAQLAPLVLAILALINSPKVVRRDAASLDRLNRKRKAVGRYTFHPHHVVRLNVDRKSVRVGASNGGDGASRALHFVRAHLRLWEGRYILVQPHWRGDAQIGIVKPGYEIDRQTSTWSS